MESGGSSPPERQCDAQSHHHHSISNGGKRRRDDEIPTPMTEMPSTGKLRRPGAQGAFGLFALGISKSTGRGARAVGGADPIRRKWMGGQSRPNESLFQHACTAIQPSCNEHKAGAVQERRSRQELAAACRERWDERVWDGGDWARAWWGGHIKPQTFGARVAPPTPCRLPRWLSNPSASHRTPPTDQSPAKRIARRPRKA